MENWILLNEKEYDDIWNRFCKEFSFNPNTDNRNSYKVPSPFVIYDISDYFKGYWDDWDDEDHIDLENKLISAFIECTNEDDYIYALDWQHDGYWVNPRLEFIKDEFDEWLVPFFPNGDYYFFLQKDFEWGYLSHPWQRSICIFGEKFVKSLRESKPKMLKRILSEG